MRTSNRFAAVLVKGANGAGKRGPSGAAMPCLFLTPAHTSHEADEDDATRHRRTIAPIGEVDYQESDRIGQGSPGKDVGERHAAEPPLNRELHENLRRHHDKRYGDDERQICGKA
jgi:hypothetical protein